MSKLRGRKLGPYHVVVSKDKEHLVEESLRTIPNRRRPKLKNSKAARELLTRDDGFDVFSEIDTNAAIWAPERTFLCTVRDLRNEASVTQSTAGHYGGVLNPRRYVI